MLAATMAEQLAHRLAGARVAEMAETRASYWADVTAAGKAVTMAGM